MYYSKLSYYGARYYDPEIGQWLSIDPLYENYPGNTPYNFVMGNPISLKDRFGMASDLVYDSDHKATVGEITTFTNYDGKVCESYTIYYWVKGDMGDWVPNGNEEVVVCNTPIDLGSGTYVDDDGNDNINDNINDALKLVGDSWSSDNSWDKQADDINNFFSSDNTETDWSSTYTNGNNTQMSGGGGYVQWKRQSIYGW